MERAVLLRKLGIDAIEPSFGIMETYLSNIRPYVALTFWRALCDWVLPWLWRKPASEAYFRSFAVALRRVSDVPIIPCRGHANDAKDDRRNRVWRCGLYRHGAPVRSPNQFKAGRRGTVDCVSCNICLEHDGFDPLRCWRKSIASLVQHSIWMVRQRVSRR